MVQSNDVWMSRDDAAKALECSAKTLHRRKDEGFLKAGIHYRRLGPGATSKILWNVPAIKRAMSQWP